VSSTTLLSPRHDVQLTDLQLVRGRSQPPVRTRRNWRWKERGRAVNPSDNGKTRDFETYLLRNKRKTAKEKRLSVEKGRPTKRKVNRWRTEMKPSLSSSCQLAVSSVSEEYDYWGEESEAGWSCFTLDSCLKTATMQDGFDEKKVDCSAHSLTMAFVSNETHLSVTTSSTVARTVFWDFSNGAVLFFGLFLFRFLS